MANTFLSVPGPEVEDPLPVEAGAERGTRGAGGGGTLHARPPASNASGDRLNVSSRAIQFFVAPGGDQLYI